MKKTLALFILGLMLVTSVSATAAAYRRVVNFEWEPVENSRGYEIEIAQAKSEGGKAFKFKLEKPVWDGKLAPGRYTMRIRSYDFRKVPGEWSEPSDFPVGLESSAIISPPLKAVLPSKPTASTEVRLQWRPVPGASLYKTMIESTDGTFRVEGRPTSNQWTVSIPVSKSYVWKVLALGPDNVFSDAPAEGNFVQLGPKLKSPKIDVPENEFVRTVQWDRPADATAFDVLIKRYDKPTKKWIKMSASKDQTENTVQIDLKWPGGDYRISVRAKFPLRDPSPIQVIDLKVHKGDRSPASEFNSEIRKSIERVNGWYGIASYLITMIDFNFSNYDIVNGLASSYSAVGGTGRVGLGWFKPNQSWGFLSIVDLSGFTTDDGKTLTYASAEFNGVYRKDLSLRTEFRSQMGIFFKEHQLVTGGQLTTSSLVYSKAGDIGPHLSGEFWYSATPKLGFQLNAHMYYGMLKVNTPNGQPLVPTMSTQYGILGSYRFSRKLTGLVGYAMREDNVKFKSITVDPRFEGQSNSATVKGNYLNFFAEYNF